MSDRRPPHLKPGYQPPPSDLYPHDLDPDRETDIVIVQRAVRYHIVSQRSDGSLDCHCGWIVEKPAGGWWREYRLRHIAESVIAALEAPGELTP